MRNFVAWLMLVLAWLWMGGAGAAFGVPPKRAPAGGTRGELYSVIRIGDEVKVIRKADVAQEKKTAANKYKADLKAYQDAKKAAAKNKDEATELKKPIKPIVKVLKESLKSKTEADDYRNNYLEEHEELRTKNAVSGIPRRSGASGTGGF